MLSLPKGQASNILGDDYCHKKLKTIKIKATTLKQGTLNYKGVWDMKTSSDFKPVFNLSDEVKIGFPLLNRFYAQSRLKRSGEIRYHFDFGNVKIAQKDINLFGNIKTNQKFENLWMRFGYSYFSRKCDSMFRVERDPQGQIMIAGKNQIRHGDFTTGLVGIFNITNMNLTKYDSFIGYHCKNWDISLQHNSVNNKQNQIKLGKLTADLAYKINDNNKIALSCKNDFTRNKIRLILGGETIVNNKLIFKGKIDNKGKTTFVGRYKLYNNINMTIGSQLNLQNGFGFLDTKKIIPIPFGYTIDMTI